MKKVYLLLLLALFTVNTFASDVIPVENAQLVAKNFISERYGKEFALSDFSLDATETDSEGNPVYYRFKVGVKGFILVSASSLTIPVLAYSLESNFHGNETASYLLEQYKHEIAYVQKFPESAVPNSKDEWTKYSASDFKISNTKSTTKSVQPLVTTTWDQGLYYNQYCPYDVWVRGSDTRVPVGCVALTMINIMNYHQYPSSGVGGVSYVSKYGRLTANFANSIYDYNAMSNNLNSSTGYQGEFAKLIYHCGVSVRMGYDTDGSGAQSETALESLKNNWKYSQNASLRSFSSYTTGEASDYTKWIKEVIIPELDAKRPIYYAGNSSLDGMGHAWIMDGYVQKNDTTFYFHVNWGWSGADNGFYTINKLNTTSMGHFSTNERAIVNLTPADTSITNKPDSTYTRVTASSGSITDGAGNKKYAKSSYRKWMIAAPDASSYILNFKKIKTEENHDYVIIYNGPTESAGEALRVSGDYLMPAVNDYSAPAGSYQASGDFTGKTLPATLSVTADSVLVVFVSDNNDVTDYGFVLDYNVNFNRQQTCDDVIVSNLAEGILSDKKSNPDSDEKYRAKSNCEWRLRGTFISGYVFSFSKFNLKAGDVIDVISASDSNRLIYRFDINNMPVIGQVFSVNDPNMVVKFITDNKDEGEGFKLHYYSISTGLVNPNNTISDVKVYPNPVHNQLNVDVITEKEGRVQFQLMDLTGKIISNEFVEHNGGELKYNTSVQNLPGGLYMMRIQTSDAQVTRKIIVE